MNPNLYTKNLKVSYEKVNIINDLNITIPNNKITALIGPNGSGKSTILKAMTRLLKPCEGTVVLDGQSIHKRSTKEVAQRMSILPQSPTAPEGITVEELVSYGRYPHQQGMKKLTQKDRDIIAWALDVTKMQAYKTTSIDQMSGGQRQRVWIAMTLAQQTDVMFLDEPTTYLDMEHQLEVLRILKHINSCHNTTIIMVVHDLNHATRYADHVIAINKGSVVCEGSPIDVVTPSMLLDVFNVRADVVLDKRNRLPVCIPYGLKEDEDIWGIKRAGS